MDPESAKNGTGEFLPWLAAAFTAVGGFFGGLRSSRSAETDRLIDELRKEGEANRRQLGEVGASITNAVGEVHRRIDDLVRDVANSARRL